MRIKLKYGSYTHALSEAAVKISRNAILSDSGQPFAYQTRWDITGTLIAATQADLSTAITALETAYSTQGLDLKLLFEDNSNTSHVLTSANTWGGPRVVAFGYPIGDGAEYTLYRNYSITVEAEEKVTFGGNEVLRFEETVEVTGTGGQRRAVIEVLSGTPQEQITTTGSIVTAVQSGVAVGITAYPTPPSPLWAAAEQLSERRIRKKSPKSLGVTGSRVQREWEVSWSYSFISAVALTGGTPNVLL